MAEITLQNIHDCYDYGKKVALGEIELGTATMNMSRQNMNIGSARIYISCVSSMIQGKRFTGTVKEIAVSHYLTAIMADFGFDGLRKALESVRLHLEYQNMYQNLNAIRKIYDEFIDILP